MDIQHKYGVDVAVTRADDLDRHMVADAQGRVEIGEVPLVLDAGCGRGGQSRRIASVGAFVLGFDVADYTEAFKLLRDTCKLSEEQLRFIQGDVTQLDSMLDQQMFDICCLQRILHYVPYDTAFTILTMLRKRINEGGKLYISVTGMESDIGLGYECAEELIRDRFCRLDVAAVEAFSITEPVCLYTPEEFIALLQESGWNIKECWVSAFGNIKAICT